MSVKLPKFSAEFLGQLASSWVALKDDGISATRAAALHKTRDKFPPESGQLGTGHAYCESGFRVLGFRARRKPPGADCPGGGAKQNQC